MSNLIFWQTVGAVITGNALFALSLYMVWRVSKEERGHLSRAPWWVFPARLIAPGVVMFAAYMLPH